MTEQSGPLQNPRPPVRDDDDRFGELLVTVMDRARRPMLTGALIGAAVGLIGALNETDFLVLAVGISATFLAFFVVEAVLTAATGAVGWVLGGRADPDPVFLIAAGKDWLGGRS